MKTAKDKQLIGMSKEMYEAIKWALTKGKIVADLETGIVTNTKSKGTGWIETTGYKRIAFIKESKQHQPKVHQVIAVAGNLNPTGLTINHINGVKLDNRLCNLEAITNEENIAHAIRTGLQATKLNELDVFHIKRILAEGNQPQKQIAEMFNVTASTISQIKLGKTWTHKTMESFFDAEKQESQNAEYLNLQEI